jgi:hypothetical protein
VSEALVDGISDKCKQSDHIYLERLEVYKLKRD